jgi:hypothetical protein
MDFEKTLKKTANIHNPVFEALGFSENYDQKYIANVILCFLGVSFCHFAKSNFSASFKIKHENIVWNLL